MDYHPFIARPGVWTMRPARLGSLSAVPMQHGCAMANHITQPNFHLPIGSCPYPGGAGRKALEKIVRAVSADPRSEARYTANIQAILFHDGMSEAVTILNLSCYGALLAGRYFPPIGESVSLITEGKEMLANVIWIGPDRCGLLLTQPIDPIALGARYPVPAPVSSATIHALMQR